LFPATISPPHRKIGTLLPVDAQTPTGRETRRKFKIGTCGIATEPASLGRKFGAQA